MEGLGHIGRLANEHWKEYRPKMYAELKKSGQFQLLQLEDQGTAGTRGVGGRKREEDSPEIALISLPGLEIAGEAGGGNPGPLRPAWGERRDVNSEKKTENTLKEVFYGNDVQERENLVDKIFSKRQTLL